MSEACDGLIVGLGKTQERSSRLRCADVSERPGALPAETPELVNVEIRVFHGRHALETQNGFWRT